MKRGPHRTRATASSLSYEALIDRKRANYWEGMVRGCERKSHSRQVSHDEVMTKIHADALYENKTRSRR